MENNYTFKNANNEYGAEIYKDLDLKNFKNANYQNT